jgi:hypothetical protein
MGGHSHIMLFAHGNDVLEKVSDALPIVLRRDHARLPDGKVLPVVLELQSFIRRTTSTGHSPVPPDRYHRPMMGNDLDAYLSRRALPARRLDRLGVTPDFHHGLLEAELQPDTGNSGRKYVCDSAECPAQVRNRDGALLLIRLNTVATAAAA